MSTDAKNDCCSGCHLLLRDPYISCSVCPSTSICLECFSKGRQFAKHKRTHGYTVVKQSWGVLEEDWSADEEENLLNLLIQRGHGNWEDISKVLVNKTPTQCENHFETSYIENASNQLLNTWRDGRKSGGRRDQPVALVISCDAPTRPVHNTQNYKDLGGYNAARADFEFELDNLAESGIVEVDFDTMKDAALEKKAVDEEDEDGLVSHLQMASVDIYR